MVLERSHTYHPFQEPTLPIFIPNSTALQLETISVIDDIDLYYQPLEHPIVAAVLFLINLLVTGIGEIINIKVLNMMKKETSIINEITKLYILTQMIVHPFNLLLAVAVDFVHPLGEIVGDWICVLGRHVVIFGGQIILINSCITALMRYCFIVHNEAVRVYGKDQLKKLFLFMNIVIPVLSCMVSQLGNELTRFPFINKCYGIDHKVFLVESSNINMLRHRFWDFGDSEVSSPLEMAQNILGALLRIIAKLVLIATGLNIAEGILYYKMFSHMIR